MSRCKGQFKLLTNKTILIVFSAIHAGAVSFMSNPKNDTLLNTTVVSTRTSSTQVPIVTGVPNKSVGGNSTYFLEN